MKTILRMGLAVLGAALMVSGLATEAGAKKGGDGWLQYSVPFTCGLNGGDVARVVPGTYAAAVNVYNGTAKIPAALEAIAAAPGEPDFVFVGAQAGGEFPQDDVSDVMPDALLPATALQVDCGDILGGGFTFPGGPPASPYVQGFLVILSHAPLEVSLTQTASGATGGVPSGT